jgi:molybdenum cofactor synthesis domain-containing protein
VGITKENKIKVAILTVSTSCFRKEREDKSGKVLEEICKDFGFKILKKEIVPDDKNLIRNKLKSCCDKLKADVVLTTGGTGLGPFDITPEATFEISERIVPGISELMRIEGIKKTKRASLSRGISGIRGKTLIVNLPGSPEGAIESINAILEIIPHAIKMIHGGGHDLLEEN